MSTGVPPIRLPFRMRLLNAGGAALPSVGPLRGPPDADRYLAWARARTGLEDFGPYDLRIALEKLLNTLTHEADLSAFGRIAADRMIRRNLVTALETQELFATRPELDEVDVDEPLIILCTPRTGSTLLHKLLATHPEARAPRLWELNRPCPPPRPELEQSDPRIRKSDLEFGMYYRMVPEMRAIHFFAPRAVEECTHLFDNLFTCRMSFATMANRSSYTDWVADLDMTGAYRAYRRQLQILKYHYPGRILMLKSPAHIMSTEALEAVFPRARIVHLHRDPATAAGSFASLTEAVQISMRNQVDPLAIGELWHHFWAPALDDSVAWRGRTKLDVVDVDFRGLMADPVGTTRRIFEHFGLSVPEDLEERIGRYLSEHPKNEFGPHAYTLERYGLERVALHATHAKYVRNFNVSTEA